MNARTEAELRELVKTGTPVESAAARKELENRTCNAPLSLYKGFQGNDGRISDDWGATTSEPRDIRTVPRTREMLITANAFDAAAAILAGDNAPVHVLADLIDEAEFLRNGDLSGLRQSDGVLADGVQGRYCDTSRAARRNVVCKWIRSLGQGQPSAAVQRALNMIGGQA